jgi:ATP-dependent Clp protease ATP-binding subunit ClpA
MGSEVVDTEHLLLGLLRVDPTILQLVAQPITLVSVRDAASRWGDAKNKVPSSFDLPISEDAKLVFENAVSLAERHQASVVRTEHLLLALMTTKASHAAAILGEAGASLSRLEQLVSGVRRNEDQEGDPLSAEDIGFLTGLF